MKFILIVVIAVGVYVALNWDMVSSKLNSGIDNVSELKQKGDDLHENVQHKMEDAKDKMDDTKDSFEKLIDKVK